MTSVERAYFEKAYAGDPDPWGFESRWYEQRKYALTVAALPEPRYRSAFEPGCSIGVLTSLLAPRCDRLLATEIIPSALEQARERLHGSRHVTVEQLAIPDRWPDRRFDLIVLSELAYYFSCEALAEILERVAGTTVPGGTVVAVHWTGETDYPITAETAHRIIGDHSDLTAVVHHVDPEFLLDVWRRT